MKSSTKAILVIAGYLLAFPIAWFVIGLYNAAADRSDPQASGGMAAFGDLLFFLGVAGLAAFPVTGMALFFLRPYHPFWRIAAIGAGAITVTGVVALLASLSPINIEVATLRIFLAPLFAIISFLFICFAPTRRFRMAFIGMSVMEVLIFACGLFIWSHP